MKQQGVKHQISVWFGRQTWYIYIYIHIYIYIYIHRCNFCLWFWGINMEWTSVRVQISMSRSSEISDFDKGISGSVGCWNSEKTLQGISQLEPFLESQQSCSQKVHQHQHSINTVHHILVGMQEYGHGFKACYCIHCHSIGYYCRTWLL